jgi:hypothetical protein
MGHQNFGQILGLIFLSYKIPQQCAKESKTAAQNIFEAPQKLTGMQNRIKQQEWQEPQLSFFLSLNCKSTTNIISDNLPQEKR